MNPRRTRERLVCFDEIDATGDGPPDGSNGFARPGPTSFPTARDLRGHPVDAYVPHPDKVDDYIESQMRKRGIPGLSLAIIEDGRIVKAKGYGLADRDSKTPVTPSTLFQAGSISKSVAALGRSTSWNMEDCLSMKT